MLTEGVIRIGKTLARIGSMATCEASPSPAGYYSIIANAHPSSPLENVLGIIQKDFTSGKSSIGPALRLSLLSFFRFSFRVGRDKNSFSLYPSFIASTMASGRQARKAARFRTQFNCHAAERDSETPTTLVPHDKQRAQRTP